MLDTHDYSGWVERKELVDTIPKGDDSALKGDTTPKCDKKKYYNMIKKKQNFTIYDPFHRKKVIKENK